MALLSVRHTEATLDSDSDLLFSRLRLPNPSLLRSEDAFELHEPVLKKRSSLSEPEADPDALFPSGGMIGLPMDI